MGRTNTGDTTLNKARAVTYETEFAAFDLLPLPIKTLVAKADLSLSAVGILRGVRECRAEGMTEIEIFDSFKEAIDNTEIQNLEHNYGPDHPTVVKARTIFVRTQREE